MGRLVRSVWRLARVAAVVAAVVAGLVWVSKRRAREQPVVDPPVWPPLPADDLGTHATDAGTIVDAGATPAVDHGTTAVETAPEPADPDEPPAAVGEAPEPVVWVLPKEGACPDGYPVKAKLASRIYHVPGGTSYARTIPDRCYATPGDAETDGFRPAKR